ncbi:hypothetical protein HanLR1_Chr02g0054411 [Helianthus annuus]|nr:hypothetical protein HanLR1_Chr02g0054411 [Helianthus annuus]
MGNIKGLYVNLGYVSGRFGMVRVTDRVGKGRWRSAAFYIPVDIETLPHFNFEKQPIHLPI